MAKFTLVPDEETHADLRTPAAQRKIVKGITGGLTLQFAAAKAGMLEEEAQQWMDEDREFRIAVLAAQAAWVEGNMKELVHTNVRWMAAAWRIERVIPGYAPPKQQSIKVQEGDHEIIIRTQVPRPKPITDAKDEKENK